MRDDVMMTSEDDEISLSELFLTLLENARLLLIGSLGVGLFALAISFLITPIYTAKTSLHPPPQGTQGTASMILESLGGGLASAAGASLKDPAQQYVAYLESDTLRNNLIEKFKLKERYDQEYLVKTRDVLKNRVKITSDKKTTLIKIEVDDENPQFAAELANAYVSELRAFTGRLALQEAHDRREFLEAQIKEISARPMKDLFTQQAMIAGMIRQYEAARVDEQKSGPTFTQVDVATPPELKSSPKKGLIAIITTLATFFVLVLFVLIRQALRNKLQDQEATHQLSKIQIAWKNIWRRQQGS